MQVVRVPTGNVSYCRSYLIRSRMHLLRKVYLYIIRWEKPTICTGCDSFCSHSTTVASTWRLQLSGIGFPLPHAQIAAQAPGRECMTSPRDIRADFALAPSCTRRSPSRKIATTSQSKKRGSCPSASWLAWATTPALVRPRSIHSKLTRPIRDIFKKSRPAPTQPDPRSTGSS